MIILVVIAWFIAHKYADLPLYRVKEATWILYRVGKGSSRILWTQLLPNSDRNRLYNAHHANTYTWPRFARRCQQSQYIFVWMLRGAGINNRIRVFPEQAILIPSPEIPRVCHEGLRNAKTRERKSLGQYNTRIWERVLIICPAPIMVAKVSRGVSFTSPTFVPPRDQFLHSPEAYAACPLHSSLSSHSLFATQLLLQS